MPKAAKVKRGLFPVVAYITGMTFYERHVLHTAATFYPRQDLSRRLVESKQFIDRHYAQAIGLHEMAGNAFLSKYHYIRVFRQYYGMTPHRYLAEVRVAHAKKLLQTGMSVTGACFSVGFESVTSFAGLFKKMTGVSPQTCRRKALLRTAREKQF
ncbi:MAG: helix-turn-helix transcriptional regulator [Bacteroidetes bacterium]|nr:helix-turn-helix transcriptional regulator [Bacteroidota bacterium]